MNQRLGRGLNFLLSSKESDGEGGEQEATGAASDLPLDEIEANPWQPRLEFDTTALAELSKSIEAHGVMQPIVVRRVGQGYQLVAGERRLRASRKAGLKTIPAVVRDIDDAQMLTLALIENVQRRDLNPVERAKAFRRLSEEQKLNQQQIAKLAGLARTTVANSLRILDLEGAQLDAVAAGKITEGHARTLLSEKDLVRRQQLFEAILDGGLSVRSAEEQASAGGPPAGLKAGADKEPKSKEAKKLEKRMKEATGASVRITEKGEAGKIVFRYRNLAEFDRIYRAVTGEAPDV